MTTRSDWTSMADALRKALAVEVIVKTNFMAEDITVEQVQEAEHGTHPDSWTVMFRR